MEGGTSWCNMRKQGLQKFDTTDKAQAGVARNASGNPCSVLWVWYEPMARLQRGGGRVISLVRM